MKNRLHVSIIYEVSIVPNNIDTCKQKKPEFIAFKNHLAFSKKNVRGFLSWCKQS
jgi:hypothetical protein